jgi:hypothetical protein
MITCRNCFSFFDTPFIISTFFPWSRYSRNQWLVSFLSNSCMYIFNASWTWPPRGSTLSPGQDFSRTRYDVIILKRGEACFTIYHNLLHFCLTLTQLGFIFSVAILYPEILKAFVALGGLFWFWGTGAFFGFGASNPFRRP